MYLLGCKGSQRSRQAWSVQSDVLEQFPYCSRVDLGRIADGDSGRTVAGQGSQSTIGGTGIQENVRGKREKQSAKGVEAVEGHRERRYG